MSGDLDGSLQRLLPPPTLSPLRLIGRLVEPASAPPVPRLILAAADAPFQPDSDYNEAETRRASNPAPSCWSKQGVSAEDGKYEKRKSKQPEHGTDRFAVGHLFTGSRSSISAARVRTRCFRPSHVVSVPDRTAHGNTPELLASHVPPQLVNRSAFCGPRGLAAKRSAHIMVLLGPGRRGRRRRIP